MHKNNSSVFCLVRNLIRQFVFEDSYNTKDRKQSNMIPTNDYLPPSYTHPYQRLNYLTLLKANPLLQ